MKHEEEDLILEIMEITESEKPAEQKPVQKQEKPAEQKKTDEKEASSRGEALKLPKGGQHQDFPDQGSGADRQTAAEPEQNPDTGRSAEEFQLEIFSDEMIEEMEREERGPRPGLSAFFGRKRFASRQPAEEDRVPEEPETPDESEREEAERYVETLKRPVHVTEEGRLPLSVSIETDGGLVSRIAEIGDSLPLECTREFSVGNTSIHAVALNLYAGERPVAAQNRLIANFKMEGIEQLPAGRPMITIRFAIGLDYTIRIEALDEGSLKQCTQIISSSWVPSETEIYEMVQVAQDNLDSDNKIRERGRLLYNARECLFRADTVLKTKKKELPLEERRKIREKSKRLQQRMKKLDVLDMTELNEKAITDAVNSLNKHLR